MAKIPVLQKLTHIWMDFVHSCSWAANIVVTKEDADAKAQLNTLCACVVAPGD